MTDRNTILEPVLAFNYDRLTVNNLHLDTGVQAPYVFGERKTQPASVSIALDLDAGVGSSARTDALDQNTVHYGNLAKAVRDRRPERQAIADLAAWVEGKVEMMTKRDDGTSRVGRCEVCVALPRASMAGSGVEVVSTGGERRKRLVEFRVKGVRIMVLIGVNAVERTAKQPLEVDLELCCRGVESLKRDVEALGLEREMVAIIEPTTFETLESLGEHTVEHLLPKVEEALPECYQVRLVLRKPKAIAFADAPELSLTRSLARAGDRRFSQSASDGGGVALRLIKPYI